MNVVAEYALPSMFDSAAARASLSLSPEVHRPLRFVGRVKQHVLSVRFALQALGRVIWSDDTWVDDQSFALRVLDPVVTVHPDRVVFEAFSQDLSSSATVILSRDLFETEGEVVHGTTNVDFTAWLAAALDEMRSRRETWLRVEPAGVEVRTAGAGGRYQPKVDVPDAWVRGFLSLQAALAMPGTRLAVRPVDLLAAIRTLTFTKSRLSPRGLRYVFEPDREPRLFLEPWEQEIPLKGAVHAYTETRTVRVWGRRRLKLLEPLLPYATGARVYLKGRALPHAYAIDLPGVTFVLALSGWTLNRFAGSGGGYHLLAADEVPEEVIGRALEVVRARVALELGALAEALGVDRAVAARAVARLCRRGRVMWDLERREVRHRELFAQPLDEAALFPKDPREEAAERLLPEVRISSAAPRETRKRRRLRTPDGPVEREVVYRDFVIAAAVGAEQVEVVLSDEDRLIFGSCTCAFFRENLLNRGPCEHLLAAWRAGEPLRREAPASVAAPPAAPTDDDGEPDEDDDGRL